MALSDFRGSRGCFIARLWPLGGPTFLCYGQNEIRPCALASIRPCVRTSYASVRPLRPCVQYTWTTSSLSIGYGRIEICPTMDEMELVRTKKGDVACHVCVEL